jgi:hypothetical protein
MRTRDIIRVEFIPPEKWWHRAKWKLLEEYTSANYEIIVPIGFITDGASIPFFARKYFSPTGRYFGAAIVHDYIILSEDDWDEANYQFDEEIKTLGVGKIRHWFLMTSVNIWGWFKKTFKMKPKPLD